METVVRRTCFSTASVRVFTAIFGDNIIGKAELSRPSCFFGLTQERMH